MTPAVVAARKANIPFDLHEYDHDPSVTSYGDEAAEKLGVDAGCIFKTLVVETGDKKLAVAILPVGDSLNTKAIAAAVGAKKAELADKALVQRVTGYVLGGVSPLGQKKRLATVIDDSALRYERIYVSGGRRGLDISLAPNDLAALCHGSFVSIVR